MALADDSGKSASANQFGLCRIHHEQQTYSLGSNKQTGTGTLTSRDVEILRSGYICPVQTRTPHGLILFFDNSRLPPNVPLLQFQVLMYLATIFQGCSGTVVNVVRTGHGSHVQRPAPQFEPDVFCMLSDSLAYKNAGYFVVQAWEYGFEHLLQFLTFQSATVARGNLPDTNPNVVAGNSGGETLRLLEATGFSRDSLPQYLGGTMDRDNVFTDWVRMRVSLETALSTPSPLDTRNSLVPAAIQQWPGESEEDFARRRRAFYSRRKYHKKKLRNLSLEDQVTHARNSNTQLNEENRRLEGLVNQAKQIVENTLLGDAGDKKPPARNS